MRYRIVKWPECHDMFLDPKAIPLELEHAACAVPDPNGDYERIDWPESREMIEAGALTDGSSAFVRRTVEKSLVFGYLYHDTHNFKTSSSVVLSGEMPEGIETAEEYAAAIRALCDCNDSFVATQVGLEPCFGWEGHPGGNDHCWHEFSGIWENGGKPSEGVETPRAFYERFKKASEEGWNPDLEIADEGYLHPCVWVLESLEADSGVSRGVFGVFNEKTEAFEAAKEVVRRAGGDPEGIKTLDDGGWFHEELGIIFRTSFHVTGEVAG